jgi:hypothetical protein
MAFDPHYTFIPEEGQTKRAREIRHLESRIKIKEGEKKAL